MMICALPPDLWSLVADLICTSSRDLDMLAIMIATPHARVKDLVQNDLRSLVHLSSVSTVHREATREPLRRLARGFVALLTLAASREFAFVHDVVLARVCSDESRRLHVSKVYPNGVAAIMDRVRAIPLLGTAQAVSMSDVDNPVNDAELHFVLSLSLATSITLSLHGRLSLPSNIRVLRNRRVLARVSWGPLLLDP